MSTLDRRTFLKGTLWGLLGWALKWEVEEIVEAAPEEDAGWHRIALQSGDDARKINLYIDGYPVNDAPFMDQMSNPIASWDIAPYAIAAEADFTLTTYPGNGWVAFDVTEKGEQNE